MTPKDFSIKSNPVHSSTMLPYNQARSVILIFILLCSIVLLAFRLLPFIDLPNHLAEATIYKYYEDDNLLSNYYQPTPWYFPNTFHPVFCSLFPSVELGNKLFHILYLILTHVSVFLVIRQLKGNPWYGLLATVFTFNYNVTFGFVGFAISIPVLILLFYATLRYIETGRMHLNFVICLLLILLFFMHAQNALLGLVLYGCLMLIYLRKNLKRLAVHLILVPLPLLLLILNWWFDRPAENEGSTLGYLTDYYLSEYIQTFFMRFRIIVFDNFQLREGVAGLIIAATFFIAVLAPFLYSAVRQPSIFTTYSREQLKYAGVFFAIMLGCYLFAPDKLPGQTPIFQRFCTITILSAVILISVLLKNAYLPHLKSYVMVVLTAYTLLWSEYIYTFNRENRDFNETFFSNVPSNETLAALIYDNSYRGRKVYIHFPNYFIVWKQGISASKIIDYRFGVVRRANAGNQLPFYNELIGEYYVEQPEYKGVDYLLVRGTAPVKSDENLRQFDLVREEPPWRLYKNNKGRGPQSTDGITFFPRD